MLAFCSLLLLLIDLSGGYVQLSFIDCYGLHEPLTQLLHCNPQQPAILQLTVFVPGNLQEGESLTQL